MRIHRLAIFAALMVAASAPAYAVMLNDTEPLLTPEYSEGYGMLNPRQTDDGQWIPVLPPEEAEHYYDYYVSPDYPQGGSPEDWLAYYQQKRNTALEAYKTAEDYYEKLQRKSQYMAAQGMAELYQGILSGNVEIPDK